MSTKTRGVVVFQHQRGALWLTNIVRNADGTIKSGHVENGLWQFEVRSGECLAKDGSDFVVNRWPLEAPLIEVPVPTTVRGDYNAVIAWAEGELNAGQGGTNPDAINEPCDCCNGTGKIRETQWLDGDLESCMNCNGTGTLRYDAEEQLENGCLMKEKIMQLIDGKIAGAEDNACRARMQFGRLSPEELETEYGESGKKCKDFLDEAEATLKEAKAMKAWFTVNVAGMPYNESGEHHESRSHQH